MPVREALKKLGVDGKDFDYITGKVKIKKNI